MAESDRPAAPAADEPDVDASSHSISDEGAAAERASQRIVAHSIKALALLSVFSFFPNPVFPDNEIFPYYLLPVFLILAVKDARRLAWLVAGSLALTTLCVASRGSLDVVVTDTMQVIAVALALYCASLLSEDERAHFAECMTAIVFCAVAFMVLQYLFPSLVDFSYSRLVRRDASAAELEAYTGGVPGIAPEPAYMGAYLIGAWVVVRRFKGEDGGALTLATAIGVILTASLSAALTLAVLLGIQFVTSIRRVLLLALVVGSAGALAVLLQSSLVTRLDAFIGAISSDGSPGVDLLTAIDAAFGSVRLSSLVAPLSEVGCGVYLCSDGPFLKGYSAFAVLYALVAPFHLLYVLFVLATARDRLAISSALLGVFYGPVLNWPMYAGLIRSSRASGLQPEGDDSPEGRRAATLEQPAVDPAVGSGGGRQDGNRARAK